MIEPPVIMETHAQQTALIRVTASMSEMRVVMGPGIAEVTAAVTAQGIGPAGSWFTHYLKTDPAAFDFEISIPVTAPVKPVGRVLAGVWPAMKVARTTMHGGYEGLDSAWREFHGWLKANGHRATKELYQCYRVGPETSNDPGEWRTELSVPLLD